MRVRRLFGLLVAGFLVAGCVNMSTTLTIRPDGSGNLTERLTISPQLVMMMQSMKQASDSTATSEGGFFTEEEIQAKADSLRGMRLESVEMISDIEGEGYEAVYAFDNANDIRFNPSPEGALPENATKQEGESPFELLSAVDLSYTSGSPATLTVTMPRDTSGEDAMTTENFSMDTPGEGPPSEQEMRMMRQMMKDSGFRLAVSVDGKIVETNATHRSGSTITLIEMDFSKLVRDSSAFRRLMVDDQQPASPEAAVDSLNALPGMTIEPQETVTIRFR